jgi:hypothetical protein
MQIHANPDQDPDPSHTLPSQKLNFYMKNIFYSGIGL